MGFLHCEAKGLCVSSWASSDCDEGGSQQNPQLSDSASDLLQWNMVAGCRAGKSCSSRPIPSSHKSKQTLSGCQHCRVMLASENSRCVLPESLSAPGHGICTWLLALWVLEVKCSVTWQWHPLWLRKSLQHQLSAFSEVVLCILLFHTYPQPRGENVAERCPASCESLGPRGSIFYSWTVYE